jgi:hypothetical protein
VGQDYHDFFAVDLLHEFEIGIWKSVLTHLIRMLHAMVGGQDLIATLDERYCVYIVVPQDASTNRLHRFHSMPTFGRDTIRKFPGNVSELSKLAARDYEDRLQVCTHSRNSIPPY